MSQHRFDSREQKGQSTAGMASLNKRQPGSEQRESARGSTPDSGRMFALEAGLPDSRATRSADGDEVEALRYEIARLEMLRRHLQKDVVVKDAYLAALRADLGAKQYEISTLHESVARLHESIAETLSQPRYRAVDRLNRALHHVAFFHILLRRWLVGPRRLEPPSSSPPQ